jgi:hypothetical protein
MRLHCTCAQTVRADVFGKCAPAMLRRPILIHCNWQLAQPQPSQQQGPSHSHFFVLLGHTIPQVCVLNVCGAEHLMMAGNCVVSAHFSDWKAAPSWRLLKLHSAPGADMMCNGVDNDHASPWECKGVACSCFDRMECN